MHFIRIVAVAAIALAVPAGAAVYVLADDAPDGNRADAATRTASAPTPPPAPTPHEGECPSAKPNTPDGPDPWGGCFPGPKTTGVPPGTQLQPYTGPCRITTADTVIEAKAVKCDYLEIVAPNVQIRNSSIEGSVWVDSPKQGGSFAITDSTVDAGEVGAETEGKSSIGKSHFVALRVETLGGVRGIWCEYDCTVQDSWVHGQDKDESGVSHQSGVRLGSGTAAAGQRFIHNTIVCDAPNVPPDAGCSANVSGYGDFATIQHNTLTKNLLASGAGGTCAYGGSTPDKPFPDGNHNVFENNVFQRGRGDRGSGAQGHCGYWFAITDLAAGRRGNEWTRNRWDTGESMPADG
jgi:hypothetical protein